MGGKGTVLPCSFQHHTRHCFQALDRTTFASTAHLGRGHRPGTCGCHACQPNPGPSLPRRGSHSWAGPSLQFVTPQRPPAAHWGVMGFNLTAALGAGSGARGCKGLWRAQGQGWSNMRAALMPVQQEGAIVASSASWGNRVKPTTGPHSCVQGKGCRDNSF